MPFMSRSTPYGLTSQFLHITARYLLYLLFLFAFILFMGNAMIDKFLGATPDKHVYEDILFVFDLLLCFGIYVILMIRFLKKQQKYITYLVDTIHLMKGGNFRKQIEITGNNELSHLATHIDELRKTVGNDKELEKRKTEKERRLIASISHDLRTPLTTLTGYLEILLDEDFQDEVKEKRYLLHCLDRANQLQYLIATAFEHFYLTEKENSEIELLRCNSFQNLLRIIENCSSILQQKGYEIQWDLPLCRYSLVYDTRMMERLFDNVFTNIVRYGHGDDAVLIRGEVTKYSFIISLKNTIGYHNASNQSTGIGLKNCKKIMDIHKGSFISEAIDRSFLVSITFPIQNKG